MSVTFEIVEGIPDYSEIIALINAEWPPAFGEKTDAEKIEDMIESHNPDRDRVKYLKEDGLIIGFYRYTPWPREARITDAAHIYDISLLPSKQRQGLGKMMMQDLIEDCRAVGFKKLLSRSFKDNPGSIRLHENAGYHSVFETEDSIVWELIL